MMNFTSASLLSLASAVISADPPAPAAPTIISREERWLAAHNAEREKLGQAPLRWSDKLVQDAAIWARHLAATNSFDHAPEVEGDDAQGENLWMGTRGYFSPEAMVGAWLAERKLYRDGIFPDVSKSGNWIDVGHYTQLIWYNTREVGCAVASNKNDDFLVCRYFPVGNWDEQHPLGLHQREANL
jgi:hypothetical protein